MTEVELQALIAQEIHLATGAAGNTLQEERAENLKYYLGEKFGNEMEGRSQVVSSDVADTIEWMLPQLIRIFASSENTVSFEPVGAEDIEVAEQATQYVNHIWNVDNDGFLNFYTWFKDALLCKNGFIKIWWDEQTSRVNETYEGLSEDEVALILTEPDTELVTLHEYGPREARLADLTVAREESHGGVRVEPVPPEEFLISREAKSIQSARFVGHRQRRTLSSLVADGYAKDIIDGLATEEALVPSAEEEARDTFVEEHERFSSALNNDAMREVWVTECYVRVDLDGDGIAELRQITVAGAESEVLSNIPWESPVPFASLTPILMPHRFYGRAIADLVKDVQLVKSTIMRQFLDGLYLANNPRQEAVEANIVEPSELLSARPGGVVRVKERGSINPISTPFVGGPALEGLAYADKIREYRTGVSPRTQGMGDDPLHQTASGERMLFDAAQGKLELIARIFAETGVKEAFRQILWLINHYQDKERIVRLRNEWVPMAPSDWSGHMDVRVSVGLGTGDKMSQLQNAMALLELQKQALEFGFASPQNLYETAEMVVNAMGLKGVDRFFTLPEPANKPGLPGSAAPQGLPAPDMQRAALAQQAEQQKAMVQNQMALQQAATQSELAARQAKVAQERALKEKELAQDFELNRLKLRNDIALKREQAAADIQLKRDIALQEMLLKAGEEHRPFPGAAINP
ncbi:MAG: hypothetical protein EP347_05055 [Alphaproteobacteria bacterium]|nr:MAG: hypothetical protein EP347_05055 [Alphaproteobacteria bacterium]